MGESAIPFNEPVKRGWKAKICIPLMSIKNNNNKKRNDDEQSEFVMPL